MKWTVGHGVSVGDSGACDAMIGPAWLLHVWHGYCRVSGAGMELACEDWHKTCLDSEWHESCMVWNGMRCAGGKWLGMQGLGRHGACRVKVQGRAIVGR